MTEPSTRRRRRRHAAPVSRIAAAGLSASAVFGLIAAMGAGSNTATATPDSGADGPVTAAPVTAPPPVVVYRTVPAGTSGSTASSRSTSTPVTAPAGRSTPTTTSSGS